MTRAERLVSLLKPTSELLLALFALASVPVLTFALVRDHTFASDFHGWYWPAGTHVLNGLSPYSLSMIQSLHYPAPGALMFVPFALLSPGVAGVAFTILVLAALLSALWLLGVRDWRVYAAVLLWQPVVFGWETANISLLLVLGVAAAWRLRGRPVAAAAMLAALISVKLFLAPLLLWLLISRRYRTLSWTLAFTLLLNAMAWPVVGLGEISRYMQLLHRFSAVAESWGYSVVALVLHQGGSEPVAYAVAGMLACAAAGTALAAGRRGSERLVLGACLGTSLLVSPIVEAHYLTLMIVPLALAGGSLRPAWLVPLLLWVAPADHPAQWQRAIVIAIAAVTFIAAARRLSGGRTGEQFPHVELPGMPAVTDALRPTPATPTFV